MQTKEPMLQINSANSERRDGAKTNKSYVPDRGSIFPLFLSFSSSPLSYQVISQLTPHDKSDGAW